MSTKKSNMSFLPITTLVVLISFLLGMYTQQLLYKNDKSTSITSNSSNPSPANTGPDLDKLQGEVLPKSGYKFNIRWGDLGKRMVDDGVIDDVKLAKALTGTEKIPENLRKYLDGTDQKQIEINAENSQFWVDILWGLGLANKNRILDEGPMREGGNTANFASTGGWTIGKLLPMDIYSKFSYIPLSENQQVIVKEIAENVYRPCCGNSTAFPDCNHGMAALGLIELMVYQGKSKDEIYKTVLAFNSYWFTQTYYDIAYHFAKNGKNYKDVSPKEILSKTFSSGMGYQAIKKQIGDVNWPALQRGGGSCGA
ncbi:MAG: hypothetical protein A3C22_02185 [Candidatus Levybacteria bacterium RIFCSPHIGHO2_02_FULL_37_10]|nr:MAG: hypothetical protein A3C22_02185 [Candidatus Levybacteria bacterium RIFCSPHIGHO2_02_FULL_37_10]